MRKWIEAICERIEQMKCSQSVMVKTMLYCGTRLFRYVALWKPPDGDGDVKAVHFANSEADFNTSVRTRVEELDERFKEHHEEIRG
jgi:predicted  nucleic acid-binding Zn-ribbon protein